MSEITKKDMADFEAGYLVALKRIQRYVDVNNGVRDKTKTYTDFCEGFNEGMDTAFRIIGGWAKDIEDDVKDMEEFYRSYGIV